jgi:hypothetical protein
MGAAVRRFRFLGCEIIYREACLLAARSSNRIDVEFLRKGLHDLQTEDMVARIQQEIDTVDPEIGYEAILLGYARCNDGLVGVRARDLPLVLPRAHDCITFFLGSRDAYQREFDAHPGTYYMTTGWSERNAPEDGELARPAYGQTGVMGQLGLSDSYEEMVAKYGRENADFIRETLGDWKKNYTRMLYIEMGVCDETPFIDAARRQAEQRGWSFDRCKGDWSLLKKLFAGKWDEDFMIVQPGEKIVARNDDRVVDAADEDNALT